MRRALVHLLVAGPFLLVVGPAHAQLAIFPESLAVELRPGEEVSIAVALSNGGPSPLRYCLDFDRPLQRRPADVRGGSTCLAPGGRLFLLDRESWRPNGLAMTPEGRLFAEDNDVTWELTPDLHVVRFFYHPRVAELSPFAQTSGVTYNEDTGSLWWTNIEESAGVLYRVLLLEGDLDGVPTGRRIEIPLPPGGYAAGAAYDPALNWYYYVDELNETFSAVDTTGAVQPGYPVRLQRYPSASIGNGLDVHGGSTGDPEGVRIEVPAYLPGETYYSRAVVTDPAGSDLGEGSETPFPAFDRPFGGVDGIALRSRLDPNGVMYVGYGSFDSSAVVAIRPVPLAPTWLGLAVWSGIVEAGASAEVALTFRAGSRAAGVYRSTLAVEDTVGTVLAQVPLALEVLPGTAGEPGPDALGLVLVVVPNPVRDGRAAITLALSAASEVDLAAYDALGRRVATLASGVLAADTHRVVLDARSLPAGVYLLRAAVRPQAGGTPRVLTQRLTILR